MANPQECDHFDRPSNETLHIPFTEEMRHYAKRELIPNPDRAEHLRLAKESYKRKNENQEIVIGTYPGSNQLLERYKGIRRRQIVLYSPKHSSPEHPLGSTYLTFCCEETGGRIRLIPEDLYVTFPEQSIKKKGLFDGNSASVESRVPMWIENNILNKNCTIDKNFALYVFLHPDRFGFLSLDELHDEEYKKHRNYDRIVEQYRPNEDDEEMLDRVLDCYEDWQDEDFHLIKKIIANTNSLPVYNQNWNKISREDIIFIFQNFWTESAPYIHYPRSNKEAFTPPPPNTVQRFILQFLFFLLIVRCSNLDQCKIESLKNTIMEMLPTRNELANLVEAYCDLKSGNHSNPQFSAKIRKESRYLSEEKQLGLPPEWKDSISKNDLIDNILQKISGYLNPIRLDWLKK